MSHLLTLLPNSYKNFKRFLINLLRALFASLSYEKKHKTAQFLIASLVLMMHLSFKNSSQTDRPTQVHD